MGETKELASQQPTWICLDKKDWGLIPRLEQGCCSLEGASGRLEEGTLSMREASRWLDLGTHSRLGQLGLV